MSETEQHHLMSFIHRGMNLLKGLEDGNKGKREEGRGMTEKEGREKGEERRRKRKNSKKTGSQSAKDELEVAPYGQLGKPGQIC